VDVPEAVDARLGRQLGYVCWRPAPHVHRPSTADHLARHRRRYGLHASSFERFSGSLSTQSPRRRPRLDGPTWVANGIPMGRRARRTRAGPPRCAASFGEVSLSEVRVLRRLIPRLRRWHWAGSTSLRPTDQVHLDTQTIFK
jgi:hypothetical protein